MKLFIFYSIFSLANCSFSSSAYEKKLEDCKKQREFDYLLFLLAVEQQRFSEDEKKARLDGLVQIIAIQEADNCKNSVERQGYINGPLP